MNDNVDRLEESDRIYEVPTSLFTGICLTDTSRLRKVRDMVEALLV